MKIGVTLMTALLVAVLLVGCAPRLTRGESSGLKWHVTELTTSERPATYIGYKNDGRVKVYRYVVVLEDNSGVGVNFEQVETTILARPGTPPTSRTRAVTSRLPANGQLRIPMTDSTWLVAPQWFEGAARTLNDDPVARKVFKGLNDRGEPVKIAIEFHLESIPPR